MTIRAERRNGVLFLLLDTPESPINVFDHHAAQELVEHLTSGIDRGITAVVVGSAKEGSFVNGVGLMLASSVHSRADGIRLTEPTRRAYRALRECPVPTVAAIDGNCFGCGVELALQCDYRVARASADVVFYMTEIVEYLFIPAFGGTQNLPPLVGVESAADLILWGDKWGAFEARRAGLVDKVFAPDDFHHRVERFARRLRGKRKPGPAEAGSLKRTRARLKLLPEHDQPLYRACLSLMERAAARKPTERDYRRELLASADSVLAAPSKSALGFFFVRQTAQSTITRGHEGRPLRLRLAVRPEGRHAKRIHRLLGKRAVPGVAIVTSTEPCLGTGYELVSHELPASASPFYEHVPVFAGNVGRKSPPGSSSALYLPQAPFGAGVIELAAGERPRSVLAGLHRYLLRIGRRVIPTMARRHFVTDAWLAAYVTPLMGAILDGVDASRIDEVLRAYGFHRRPAVSWAAAKPPRGLWPLVRAMAAPRHASLPESALDSAWAQLVRPSGKRVSSNGFRIESVLISLAAAALSDLEAGRLAHPAVADLIARDLLDFPLRHGSLCRVMKRSFALDCAEAARKRRLPVGEASVEALARFARDGRDFYL